MDGGQITHGKLLDSAPLLRDRVERLLREQTMDETGRVFVVGVDPGQQGAVVILNMETEAIYGSMMPTAGKFPDVVAIRSMLPEPHRIRRVYLEEQHPRTYIDSLGVRRGQGAVASFSLGRGFGRLETCFLCGGLSVTEVTPQRWKKAVLVGYGHDKEGAIKYVRQRYPGFDLCPGRCRKAQDGLADAACIATYGAMKENHARI